MIDRLQTDSVYVLRVRGCNKAGFGEYSEDVYLHTPPAPGETLHGTAGLQPTDGFRWRSEVEKKTCPAENMQGQEEPINTHTDVVVKIQLFDLILKQEICI